MMDMPFSVMLSDASPTAEPAVDLGLELRPHQKAALRRCIDVETSGLSFELIRALVPHWTARNAHTRIMGLCDVPGAGKSHVIIALCAGDTPVPPASAKVSLCSGLVSYDRLATHETEIRTSVIVVPHGILHQWRSYLEDCTGVDYLVLGRRTARAVREMEAALRDAPPSILLCTDTGYGTVLHAFRSLGLRARRFVLDEADTIPIPVLGFVSANMNWMVTASASSLLACDGHRSICNRQARTWWKELYMYAPVVRSLMIVRSTDDFVRESMRLPPPVAEAVVCSPPPGAAVLRGLVSDGAQNALDTEDLALARSCLGVVGDTDDIVALVRSKWTEFLEEKRAKLRAFEARMAPGSEDAADKEYVRALSRTISEKESCLAALEERIAGVDVCGICYERVTAEDERAVMACCSAVYCLRCAHPWVSREGTCPTCRASASFQQNVHVIADPRRSKHARAAELLAELCTGEGRVLFCCSNRSVFRTLRFPGGHADMKSQGARVQRTVDAFRDGSIRTLCMANDCYCTGVNLEFATDVVIFNPMGAVEEQMIGRAQRPGRTAPLRVWRFVYSDLGTGV